MTKCKCKVNGHKWCDMWHGNSYGQISLINLNSYGQISLINLNWYGQIFLINLNSYAQISLINLNSYWPDLLDPPSLSHFDTKYSLKWWKYMNDEKVWHLWITTANVLLGSSEWVCTGLISSLCSLSHNASAGWVISPPIRLLKENPPPLERRWDLVLSSKGAPHAPIHLRDERHYHSSLAPEALTWVTAFKLRQRSKSFYPPLLHLMKWKESKPKTMPLLLTLRLPQTLFISFRTSPRHLLLLLLLLSRLREYRGWDGGGAGPHGDQRARQRSAGPDR